MKGSHRAYAYVEYKDCPECGGQGFKPNVRVLCESPEDMILSGLDRYESRSVWFLYANIKNKAWFIRHHMDIDFMHVITDINSNPGERWSERTGHLITAI